MTEQLARKFHETYERLAPVYGYETRKETREFDPTSPNGRLMIAVTDQVFNEVIVELSRKQEELHNLREEFRAQGARCKEFCPNCEAVVPCTHEAELFVCDICGEDFAKYIVSRKADVSDYSVTQNVLTDIKTPCSIENNNPDYYKHGQNQWISIANGRLPERFQECIVLDKNKRVHNWIHDDALLPLFAQYTHWMPLLPPTEDNYVGDSDHEHDDRIL